MENFEINIMNYIANNDLIVNKLGVESLYPLFTTETDKTTITYDFTPISSDVISDTRLKLKIISKSYDEAKDVEMIIRQILDHRKQKPFIKVGETYFKSSLAGGGCLYNDGYDMWENTLTFIIKWRC